MALHVVIPSSQRHSDALVEQRPLSWDDIGGLEDVKLQLQQVSASNVQPQEINILKGQCSVMQFEYLYNFEKSKL